MRSYQSQDPKAPSALPAAQRLGELGALRTLLPYLWPKGEWGMRTRVVLSLLLLAGGKVATVYVPLFYKGAVDGLSGEAGALVAVPVGFILAYGLARVLGQAFGELRNAVFEKVAQRAIRRSALAVFRHLHALSLRFHLERQTGGLSRSVERGTRAIDNLLSMVLFNILPTLLEIGLVTIILWRMFDVWFALVTFATVGGYVAYSILVTNWRTRIRRQMLDADTKANARAIDTLLNYETVKYFGNEAFEAGRYDKALQSYERAATATASSLSMLNVGQGVIIALGVTLVMWMAASGIVAGRLTLGDFVLVNTYLLQLYQPLNVFGFMYRGVKEALTDMEKMFELLSIDREVEDAPGAPPLAVSGGEVRFENVSFGYDPRRPILKNVSFTVPAGRTVAIVGPSGAGKSTLSRLLFRFYDVTSGRVLIDGQDVRQVTQGSLRAAIGIVPQDTVLFNETIYYNVAYGRPDAERDEVERAAGFAQILPFISALPDGWNSMVGERGLKLSGGEKQRVAIARTILKRTPILLFDEATSALDTHTEREIQASLRQVAEGHTTLVIAHRLSTVVDADEIIVLDEGELVERGSHAQLLAQGGAYAALWTRQLQSAAENAAAASDAAAD